jgi:hypothetical protein
MKIGNILLTTREYAPPLSANTLRAVKFAIGFAQLKLLILIVGTIETVRVGVLMLVTEIRKNHYISLVTLKLIRTIISYLKSYLNQYVGRGAHHDSQI